jgi:hypothetical protein
MQRDGDGNVRAWWLVAIGAVCAARTDQDAKDLSGYYGAAIRLAMMHMPELGGWAAGVEWNDERYDDWAPILEQMVSSVRLVFTIEVDGVINVFEGFRTSDGTLRTSDGTLTVPSDPYAPLTPYPEITTITVNVDHQS